MGYEADMYNSLSQKGANVLISSSVGLICILCRWLSDPFIDLSLRAANMLACLRRDLS